ncbi:unnamed protein product [Pylaiella littoralis]
MYSHIPTHEFRTIRHTLHRSSHNQQSVCTTDEVLLSFLAQRLEAEERERKRLERLRLKEEEKMNEEIDLYERGLCARQRAAFRDAEKAQAEQHWRRLVAIRQRRRKGTPGAAAAVNNLGVLLVEQSERDSVHSAEGRKLLKAAVAIAEAGLKKTGEASYRKSNNSGKSGSSSSSSNAKPSTSSAPSPKTTAPKEGGATEVDEMKAGQPQSPAAEKGSSSNDDDGHDTNGVSVAREDEEEEWRALLALFGSNFCFATEGPGRNNDHYESDDMKAAGEESTTERDSENGNSKTRNKEEQGGKGSANAHIREGEGDGGGEGGGEATMEERCIALFESLSPAALSVCSGPSDSWECLGVGVTLFERQGPFWWERAHPEDDERRELARAEHESEKSKARRKLDDLEGGYDGTRRDGVVRNREHTDATATGGYTDLEVLEVINPGKAARIRLRQARHAAQHERRVVLLKRRKEFQRQLRLQEEEAAAARAASALAREAYHEREVADWRLKKSTDERESRRRAGRFVRAAGAVKALRAKTLGGDGRAGTIELAVSRLAKTLTTTINRWDAGPEEDGDGEGDRAAVQDGEKGSPAGADIVAEAAAARAVARAAVRQGAAARAKSGGGGGKTKAAQAKPAAL